MAELQSLMAQEDPRAQPSFTGELGDPLLYTSLPEAGKKPIGSYEVTDLAIELKYRTAVAEVERPNTALAQRHTAP